MAQIYLGIKYHADHRNRPLIEAVSQGMASRGHRIYCVARDLEGWGAHMLTPSELMEHTFEAIRASDVVVIELSEKGVGLGIEAGYAYACGKPIFTLARYGSDISSTLRGLSKSVHFYSTSDELCSALEHALHELIGA